MGGAPPPYGRTRPRGRPRNSKTRQLSHSAEDRHVQQPSTLIEPLDTKRHSICSAAVHPAAISAGLQIRYLCAPGAGLVLPMWAWYDKPGRARSEGERRALT
jgi:hypothetical protein